MKIVAMIQARLKSTRFPGKVLEKIKQKTIIEIMIERLKKSQYINQIVVVIPDTDEELKTFVLENNLNFYAGSEENVLKRFYDANKQYFGDHVVRLTADCPLIDVGIVDGVISEHLKNSNDFTTNSWLEEETFPDGLDVAVMRGQILSRVNAEAKELKDREHVVTYIYDNKTRFKTQKVEAAEKFPEMRLTLDYKEDLEVIKSICNEFPDFQFSIKDIIKLYHSKSDIFKANIQKVRNESYIEQLEKKKPGRPKIK